MGHTGWPSAFEASVFGFLSEICAPVKSSRNCLYLAVDVILIQLNFAEMLSAD
jgi:hypothetical protein